MKPTQRQVEKQVKKDGNTIFRVAGVAAMAGDILAADTLKEKNDWKLRMLKASFGDRLMIPEDWDTLTEEVKAERLNKIVEFLTKE